MDEKAEVGRKVKITLPGGVFYKTGAVAMLKRFDGLDWWGQFREQGNSPEEWNDDTDGIWCIGVEGVDFVLLEDES